MQCACGETLPTHTAPQPNTYAVIRDDQYLDVMKRESKTLAARSTETRMKRIARTAPV